MKLNNLEEQLIELLNINRLKVKCSQELKEMLCEPNSELLLGIQEDHSKIIDPSMIRIEYENSTIHFDNNGGPALFLRLSYLLYIDDEEFPINRYDIDLSKDGKVLDDYLLEW